MLLGRVHLGIGSPAPTHPARAPEMGGLDPSMYHWGPPGPGRVLSLHPHLGMGLGLRWWLRPGLLGEDFVPFPGHQVALGRLDANGSEVAGAEPWDGNNP